MGAGQTDRCDHVPNSSRTPCYNHRQAQSTPPSKTDCNYPSWGPTRQQAPYLAQIKHPPVPSRAQLHQPTPLCWGCRSSPCLPRQKFGQRFYFSAINSPFHMTPVSGFASRYPTKQPANVPLPQATPGTFASRFGWGTRREKPACCSRTPPLSQSPSSWAFRSQHRLQQAKPAFSMTKQGLRQPLRPQKRSMRLIKNLTAPDEMGRSAFQPIASTPTLVPHRCWQHTAVACCSHLSPHIYLRAPNPNVFLEAWLSSPYQDNIYISTSQR